MSITLFERAQFAETTAVRVSNGVVSDNVTSQGLVHCVSCGERMFTNVRYRKTGHPVLAMRCENLACPARAGIQVLDLDAEVEVQVLAKLSVALRTLFPDRRPSKVPDARQRLADAEKVREKFLDSDASYLLDTDTFNRQLSKLSARIDAGRANLAEAADADDLDESYSQPVRFKEQWLASDVPGRRAMLRRVVERIEVLPVHGQRGIPACERVRIVWREPRRRSVAIGLGRVSAGQGQP